MQTYREADDFLRVAAATPKIRVADVAGNAAAILETVGAATDAGARVLVLPELCLTGYTCGDLFHDATLLRACEVVLAGILEDTADLPLFFTVGLPVAVGGSVYNCAAACCRGQLLGLTAKRHLPNYGEFYEARWFAPAPENRDYVDFAGFASVPMGAGLTYRCCDPGCGAVRIGIEICEDLWVANPPSVAMALEQDALVILNPSASDEVIGKADYRRELVRGQSARLYCAYAYADAGEGESTTDLVFAGENLIAENGALLARTDLFTCGMAVADADLERLLAERRRSNTWADLPEGAVDGLLDVPFSFAGDPAWHDGPISLLEDEPDDADGLPEEGPGEASPALRLANEVSRVFPRTPFVPADAGDLAERCEAIFTMQAVGLATRLAHTGTRSAVIGLSGGLDSTLALLVTVRAFDRLGLPRTGVHAVSMPGFGTTRRTKSNAQNLAEALGVDFRIIPIGEAVAQHFAAIGHDPSVQDVTYENSQARERTQILMDLSNELSGFVIGTGDLSELALGWATYNADHMSMYGVNASVPKTLVRHLVRHAADVFGDDIAATLLDVLDTPVSPELLPPTGDGDIAQRTEDLVGPYELHDYFLYYVLRFGFTPGRIFRQACASFAAPGAHGEPVYEPTFILGWMRTFYRRFFAQQFKRSCLPDGPKVGSVTLSPRGDWRMPSDASSALWLAEIDALEAELAASAPSTCEGVPATDGPTGLVATEAVSASAPAVAPAPVVVSEGFVRPAGIFTGESFATRDETLSFIAGNAVELGIADDADALMAAFLRREAEGTTGMMDGFAVPHAKSVAVKRASVMVVKAPSGIGAWDTMDQRPVTVAIALLVPEDQVGEDHLRLLSKVAEALMDEDFRAAVKAEDDPVQIAAIINERLK